MRRHKIKNFKYYGHAYTSVGKREYKNVFGLQAVDTVVLSKVKSCSLQSKVSWKEIRKKVRFETLIFVKISILLLWILTPYGILCGYQDQSSYVSRVNPDNMVNMNGPPLVVSRPVGASFIHLLKTETTLFAGVPKTAVQERDETKKLCTANFQNVFLFTLYFRLRA